jgi:PAS domain S-box-containing protein
MIVQKSHKALMDTKIKILHLEDLPTDAELVEYELKKGSLEFDKRVVDNREDFIKMLGDFNPDIILSDHSLPSFDSVQALAILKEMKLEIPFILITATVSEEFAVDIMKQGASDYILKDRLQRLPLAVINSIEKRRLEEEQQAAHERLLFHIENAPLGFIEWDENGFAKSWSKRSEEIFGWTDKIPGETPENWIGQVYEEDLPSVSKLIDQLISGEVKRNKMQYRNITKDGRVIWCEWFNSVLKNKAGNVTTIMSLVQDITEQKLLERQKDDFLSMASHELKTPVTTIKAYGQIAEEMLEEKKDGETLTVIKRMGTQVDRLTDLIGNLLDFDRIQKGNLIYEEAFFSFDQMIQEIVEDMQKTSYTHQIKNTGTTDARVFGDREKLGHVLGNLISNAIKYSPYADNIVIRSELQYKGIELSVQDFGIGIGTENQQNIFQKFYRITGDSQSTFPGLGIGLFICSEIMSRHGGSLRVESTIGKGSVFHAWLPFDHRDETV